MGQDVRPASTVARIGPALTLFALVLVSYRRLWFQTSSVDVSDAVFKSGPLPLPIVVAVAGWLVWTRRDAFSKRSTVGTRAIAVPLITAGLSLFVWSHLSGKTDLLYLSLAAFGLAWAASTSGWTGLRGARLPAFVLLFGVRIPKPIEDEIIWFLQIGTTRGAGWLLDAMGRDFFQAGVMLRDAEHTFHVVDTCSGLTGDLILILISICTAQILSLRGSRAWLLVGLTPFIGFCANVVRATYIAGSPDPLKLAAIGADHTLQGVVILMGGTAFIFFIAWSLGAQETTDRLRKDAEISIQWPTLLGIKWPSLGLAGLLALSLLVPGPNPSSNPEPRLVDFPATGSGWTSEDAPAEPMFNGVVAGKFHRRYRFRADGDRPLRFVDLFVGQETDGPSFPARIFSAKRMYPGPDWNLLRTGREHNWVLDQEVDVALAAPTTEAEHAWVYTWRPRHRGLLRESWRHFMALDSLRASRGTQPTLVKLVAYSPHGGEVSLDRAKQRLNRFLTDFRADFSSL